MYSMLSYRVMSLMSSNSLLDLLKNNCYKTPTTEIQISTITAGVSATPNLRNMTFYVALFLKHAIKGKLLKTFQSNIEHLHSGKQLSHYSVLYSRCCPMTSQTSDFFIFVNILPDCCM